MLQISPQNVKRVSACAERLQITLAPSLRDALKEAFPFAGADCDALTESVSEKFGARTHYTAHFRY